MNFSLKYYKTAPTITVILLLAACIDFVLLEFLFPIISDNIEGFIRAPGNTSLIASFLSLHNKFLWKYPVFNFLVKIPNLNGRYEGNIKYEFDGKKGNKDCALEVIQDASNVKITSYFNNEEGELTTSESLVEDIKEKDGFHHIYFFYLNSGTKVDGSLDCHEGANELKFIPSKDTSKLVGHYFTNRQKQTKGIIEVKFKSKILKGEF